MFDRPALMRAAAVDRLGLRGEERIAGLVTGADYPDALQPLVEVVTDVARRICDVGAGLGAGSVHLARGSGVDVVATEPEVRTARTAREWFPGLEVAAAEATHLPFAARTCGAVTFLGAVSLVADLDTLLAEAARVVLGGGCLGIADLVRAPGRQARGGPKSFRTVEELVASAATHGFGGADVWDAPADLATRWDPVKARVDEEMERHHAGSDAIAAWREDRRQLRALIAAGTLRLATVTAVARS